MEIKLGQSDVDWVNNNIKLHWIHDDPVYAYTAGLWRYSLPELIVVGLGQAASGMTLNLLAARMHKYGAFKAGDIDIDLFKAPTKFGSVALPEIAARMTRTIEAGFPNGRPPLLDLAFKEPGVLQVLWPDRIGIFPDERGFSREFAHQKVLA